MTVNYDLRLTTWWQSFPQARTTIIMTKSPGNLKQLTPSPCSKNPPSSTCPLDEIGSHRPPPAVVKPRSVSLHLHSTCRALQQRKSSQARSVEQSQVKCFFSPDFCACMLVRPKSVSYPRPRRQPRELMALAGGSLEVTTSGHFPS